MGVISQAGTAALNGLVTTADTAAGATTGFGGLATTSKLFGNKLLEVGIATGNGDIKKLGEQELAKSEEAENMQTAVQKLDMQRSMNTMKSFLEVITQISTKV